MPRCEIAKNKIAKITRTYFGDKTQIFAPKKNQLFGKWLAEIMPIGCKRPNNQSINKSFTHLIFSGLKRLKHLNFSGCRQLTDKCLEIVTGKK